MKQLVNIVECRQSRPHLDSSQFINTLRAMANDRRLLCKYLLLFVKQVQRNRTQVILLNTVEISRRPRYLHPSKHEYRLLPAVLLFHQQAYASQLARVV
jgi:hypothetical protein